MLNMEIIDDKKTKKKKVEQKLSRCSLIKNHTCSIQFKSNIATFKSQHCDKVHVLYK